MKKKWGYLFRNGGCDVLLLRGSILLFSIYERMVKSKKEMLNKWKYKNFYYYMVIDEKDFFVF